MREYLSLSDSHELGLRRGTRADNTLITLMVHISASLNTFNHT